MPEAWQRAGMHALITLGVIVLHVLVRLVTVGNLSVDRIVAAEDYALAEAARPFLGQAGFTLIAVAAMLSTASAINATLYLFRLPGCH